MTNPPAPKAWVPALDVPVPDWRRGKGGSAAQQRLNGWRGAVTQLRTPPLGTHRGAAEGGRYSGAGDVSLATGPRGEVETEVQVAHRRPNGSPEPSSGPKYRAATRCGDTEIRRSQVAKDPRWVARGSDD